ncbi:MAG TPA: hypothetical protein VEK57_25670 [Thermoanaerobaculia bacterium]|nr:hypothetical protein [Thermoanaerobaculia bacterium]
MSKALQNKNLSGRPATRTLLAVSLALTLAAFGCTTNRTLGNGDPVMTPGSRFTPTGGIGSGSESAPSIPPPMMSSSTYSSVSSQALPRVTSRASRLSPDEAAAIMAAQAPRVRVLGPAVPGPANRPYASDGQFINPALQTNPQLTINSSSLISQPVTGITSGAGEAIIGGSGVVVSGATTTGTGLTLAGNVTTGAVISTPTATVLTPTAAAIPLPVGTFASSTVSPTAVSAVNPSATIAASPTVIGTAASVRLVVDANGRTVMTNASTRPQ